MQTGHPITMHWYMINACIGLMWVKDLKAQCWMRLIQLGRSYAIMNPKFVLSQMKFD